MASNKPLCKYGAACYRKNKEHLRKFTHPPPPTSSDCTSPLPPAKRPRTEDHVTPSPPYSINAAAGGDFPSPQASTDVARLPSPQKSPSNHQTAAASSEGVDVVTPPPSSDGNSDDPRDDVCRKFLVQMPEDFYQFWELCKTINSSAPQLALQPTLGLELVGPYHVLAGQLRGVAWQQCVLHSRHYCDPPEMVTVLSRPSDGLHLGYFRDDPKDVKGCLLVTNTVSEGFELTPIARHIFDAVRLEVISKLERPSKLTASEKNALQQLKSALISRAEQIGLNFSDPKSVSKERSKVVLSKCLHKMGLVVPYDESTELGYRSLPMSDRELLKLLNKISNCKDDDAKRDREFEPLQEIITFVQFANDECDYGMGLELGLDLFSHGGKCFHGAIGHLLPLAYDLLQRVEFGRVVGEHLANRSKQPLDFRRK